AQILGELEHLRGLVLRAERRPADSRHAADVERRDAAAELRVLGNAFDAVLRILRIAERQLQRARRNPVPRRAELAEHRAAHYPRPAADQRLATIENVTGEIARRDRIHQRRRLETTDVHEAVAREKLIAALPHVLIGADV